MTSEQINEIKAELEAAKRQTVHPNTFLWQERTRELIADVEKWKARCDVIFSTFNPDVSGNVTNFEAFGEAIDKTLTRKTNTP